MSAHSDLPLQGGRARDRGPWPGSGRRRRGWRGLHQDEDRDRRRRDRVVAGAAAVAAARAGLFQSGLHITVNGSDHQVQVDPNTPLLYVLRNEVGLKGLRFGCGLAECGACTVQLDGRAIRSCITKVSQASGKAVTTLEGLGTEANPSKLQKAFTILPPAFADAGRLQPPLKLADDLSQVRPPEPDRRRGGG